MYQKFMKRILDILLSLAGLVLLSPVMLMTAFLVRIRLGRPVIFHQKRPGKNGRVFEMYKFRSMSDEKDKNGNFLSDEERLSEFGKRLRSTSLDELPELFNVLRGDMSIVGPRPLLMEYLPLYSKLQRHRHDVRPGLTGLAQVKGRNAVSWNDKFSWDVRYVKKVSLKLDLYILLKTVQVVLKHEGIKGQGSQTMNKFEGNEGKKACKKL